MMHTPVLRRTPVRAAIIALLGVMTALLVSSCTGAAAIIPEQGWSGPTAENSIIYIGSRQGKVLAIKTTDVGIGRPYKLNDKKLPALWRYPADEDETIGAVYSTPVIAGNTLLVGALGQNASRTGRGNGDLHALDKTTGELKWVFPTKGRIFSDPVVVDGVVYFADDDNERGFVYAVDLEKGEALWSPFETERRIWATPTVVDGVIYVAAMDKHLYAIDPKSGSLKSKIKVSGAIASKPLIAAGVVYFGAFDRRFYAFDLATGQEKWQITTEGWVWNDAMLKDGVVYFGSLGGIVYALDAETGAERWQADVDGPVRADTLIAGERLYVADRRGKLSALELKSGTLRKTETAGASVLATPFIDGSRIYVSDFKQNLHVFTIGP